ncbi:hypothetical protein Tco_0060107 [Tanacetum coccineum]
MPDKDKVLSEDPFNLYDILNKRKDSGDKLEYPPGFTPSGINMEEVNKKVKGATSNEKKLQALKIIIKQWTKNAKKSSYKAKISILSKLSNMNKLLDQGDSSEEISSDKSLFLKELNDINSIDSLKAAQKSKVHWAIEGDENTKFFHGILNSKRS